MTKQLFKKSEGSIDMDESVLRPSAMEHHYFRAVCSHFEQGHCGIGRNVWKSSRQIPRHLRDLLTKGKEEIVIILLSSTKAWVVVVSVPLKRIIPCFLWWWRRSFLLGGRLICLKSIYAWPHFIMIIVSFGSVLHRRFTFTLRSRLPCR
ncbi:unnamed protein product [Calypogeia fissa]